MVEHLVVASRGEQRLYSYDEIQINGKYNQVLFREWRRNNSRLFCSCNPLGPVIMNLAKRPLVEHEYYLRTKPKPNFDHIPSCCRYNESQSKGRPKQAYRPSVEYAITDDGKPAVLLHMDPLFAVEDDHLQVSVDDLPEADIEVRALRKNVQSPGLRIKQDKAGVGALLREWYILAYERAKDLGYQLNKSSLLRSMQVTLRDHQINVKGIESLPTVVCIPHPRLYVRYGEEKVIVGYPIKKIRARDGEDVEAWYVAGLDGAKWRVLFARRHLPERHSLNNNRLCLIRIQNRLNDLVTTHRVTDALIHPDGAVWLDSSYEFRVYSTLKQLGFPVTKPLKPMDEYGGFQPDFVLHTSPRTLIEVWGMPHSNEAYQRHRAEKETYYRALSQRGLIRYCDWDVRDGDAGFSRLREQLRLIR